MLKIKNHKKIDNNIECLNAFEIYEKRELSNSTIINKIQNYIQKLCFSCFNKERLQRKRS
jgi:hypothetical protein